MKVIAIGRVNNLWYGVWTRSKEFDTTVGVDTGALNKAMFAEFILVLASFFMFFYHIEIICFHLII